jgi:hypothetical protein
VLARQIGSRKLQLPFRRVNHDLYQKYFAFKVHLAVVEAPVPVLLAEGKVVKILFGLLMVEKSGAVFEGLDAHSV